MSSANQLFTDTECPVPLADDDSISASLFSQPMVLFSCTSVLLRSCHIDLNLYRNWVEGLPVSLILNHCHL